MAVQTYGSLSALQRTAYEKITLQRALPKLLMFKDGLKGSVPKNSGLTVQWRAWAAMALATTALTEGTPPADTALSVSTVTATVLQYGAWTKASDLLAHQGIDPTWTNIYQLLGEQSGQTLHTVLVNVLAAGTNVRYAAGRVSRVTVAAGDNLTVAEIRKARRTLAAANASRFPDGFYHALVHPNATFDIQSDTAWLNPGQYGAGKWANPEGGNIVTGEIGALYGVKFFESTDAPVFAAGGAGGIDVYGTLIYGPGWYGIRDLEAQKMPGVDPETNLGIRVTGVDVDVPTKDDALGQFGVAGWKCAFISKILQQFRGVRIEHAVTA